MPDMEADCPMDHMVTKEEVDSFRDKYDDLAVADLADYIGSTSGIIKYATESSKKEFIIGTEIGVSYKLQSQNPDKKFYFMATKPTCQDMKLVTLEKVLEVLEFGSNQASVKADLVENAKKPLEMMLSLAK